MIWEIVTHMLITKITGFSWMHEIEYVHIVNVEDV